MLKKMVQKICFEYLKTELSILETAVRDECSAKLDVKIASLQETEDKMAAQMADLAELQATLLTQAKTLSAWQQRIEARYNEDIEVMLHESRSFNERMLESLVPKKPLLKKKKGS